MIALLLNHLWQSSLCVAGAGLLTLALHRNGANVRFLLWFAASVKFLVPFAAVTALGAYLLTPVLPPVAAPAVILMEPFARPFSATARSLSTAPVATAVPAAARSLTAAPTVPAVAAPDLGSALLALWAAGLLIIAFRWLVRWSRVRALLREARTVQIDAPIAVKFSSSRLEPGLVGILRPVILLPQGIEQQLSQAELRAVLAHELCHWRRHDNLLAAIHMLVEALFWFFPLVWWLGARLNAERERACDESVLAAGNDPEMYAEGILKVCRAYLQSPLACVAGVSGAGLKKRIDTIMENRLIPKLNAARKFVLGTSAAATLVLPLTLGLRAAPVAQMQARAAVSQRNAHEAATTGADPALNERDRIAVVSQETASVPHRQIETPANGQPETLVPPTPDLSRLLPAESLPTPMMVASNDQPAAPVPPATPVPSTGLVAAATPASTGSAIRDAPRPKTETGLRCVLGMEPDGCWRLFENPPTEALSHCAVEQPLDAAGQFGEGVNATGTRFCPWGPLESIEYLGTNATGDDVYSVRFMHKTDTSILSPPGPDGKIATRCISSAGGRVRCRGGHVALSAEVTSPAGQARILYTRPAAWR